MNERKENNKAAERMTAEKTVQFGNEIINKSNSGKSMMDERKEREKAWMNYLGSERYKSDADLLADVSIYYAGFDDCAKIAKQDEKELLETLIEIQKAQYQPAGPLSGLNTIIKLSRAIIEKHTGKTWEELNE